MKTIERRPPDEVQPGAVLADAVLDMAGHVLMPAGTVLTESAIAGLVRREVPEVAVKIEVTEDPAETEAYREKLVDRLDRLFRHAGKDPQTQALYQAVLDYRMEVRQ